MTKPITNTVRRCAAWGCKEKFVAKRENHLYHHEDCKNREGQRRLRERAKMNGSMKKRRSS